MDISHEKAISIPMQQCFCMASFSPHCTTFLHNDSLFYLSSWYAESWDDTLPAALYANNNLLVFQR